MATITRNQSWDDYRAIGKLNASTLVHGLKSMLHLRAAIDGPQREPTDAMRLGTAIHSAILEPDEFEQRFSVVPDFHLDAENVTQAGKPTKSKATKYCKERREEYRIECETNGRELLPGSEHWICRKCKDAVHARHHARVLIVRASREVTVEGEILGVPIKGRIDAYCQTARQIVDLKTTRDASPQAFGRVFANLHYGFRLALYRELIRQATGDNCDVEVIAQETVEPWDTVCYRVPEVVLDHGLSKVHQVVQQYKHCLETGRWPGCDAGQDAIELVVPQWAMEDSGDDLLDWGDSDSSSDDEQEVYF